MSEDVSELVEEQETAVTEDAAVEQPQKESKYNERSRMGFMRAIQVGNIFMILVHLMTLFFITGSSLKGIATYSAFNMAVNVVGMGEIVWLIGHRKQYTRQIAMVIYGITFLNDCIASALIGTITVEGVIVSAIMPGLLALYFATSRRAKAVLVQPFDVKRRSKEDVKDMKTWNPKSLDFWMRLLIYFFVFSVAGHWMEMGVQVLVTNGLMPGTVATPDSLTWRDSLNPFPIYGISVAICGLALYPVYLKFREKCPKAWQAFALSFLVNTLFCTVAELALGLAFNADLHAWDYRDQFLNFEGQICFLYSMCFGVMSSAITWFLYPFMERQFSYISKDVFRAIFVGSFVLYLFIFITYNIDLNDMGMGDLAINAEEVEQEAVDEVLAATSGSSSGA